MSKQAEIELLKNMLVKAEAELAAEEAAKKAEEKPQGIWPVVEPYMEVFEVTTSGQNGIGFLGSEAVFNSTKYQEIGSYVYTTEEQAKRIAFALQVFGEMNRHPLAVLPVDGVEQFTPRVLLYGLVAYDDWNDLRYKISSIFPFFNSTKDARKAVNDVGADRLLLAAKYWKGLTE